MQQKVMLVSTDNLDKTITVLIGGRRIEFFLKPDCYLTVGSYVRKWIEDGWYNHVISQLIQKSDRVLINGISSPPWAIQQAKEKIVARNFPKPQNTTSAPDEDHRFTLIAPEAQNGLIYQGQRIWHTSAEAAVEYSKQLYNANKDAVFELVVVQAIESVQPKPQVELLSRTFGKKEST